MLLQAFVIVCLLSTLTLSLRKKSEIAQPRSVSAEYLLPTHIKPLFYEIELEPDISNEVFNGSVSIEFTVLKNTSTVTLHSRDLEIEGTKENIRVFLAGQHSDSLPILKTAAASEDDKYFYTIIFDGNLEKGTNYQLVISQFTGTLNREGYGFYSGEYIDVDGQKRKFATTQFESAFARRAFPCFDEPAQKAHFKVSIIRPETFTSIANTPMESLGELVTDGRFRDTFETTPPMSTYLIAFIVSDFAFTDLDVKGYGRVYARPEVIARGLGNYALEMSPKVIEVLAAFVNMSFPLKKIDQVAIPDGFFKPEGMENWGLVTYRESYLLYNKNSTASSKGRVTSLICHEFSHQWFGDLVSPRWWRYIWLNEGFATYFQYFATAEIEPDSNWEELFVVSNLQYVLKLDSYVNTRAMNSDVGSTTDIEATFDIITYYKASSVIRMAETFLTTPVFRFGLHHYLAKMQYSAAEPIDLYSSWQEAVDLRGNSILPYSVSDIMSTWDSQEGYPLVDVYVEYSTGVITFRQVRFLIPDTNMNSSSWMIPINYAIQDKTDFSDTSTDFWLINELLTVVDNDISRDKWIIVNKQQRGYYRVNYNEENWFLLINYLHSDSFDNISSINRAQLIDDSFQLAIAGRLNHSIAFQIADYLSRETDFAPVSSFLNSIDALNVQMSASESYVLFSKWVIKNLAGVYAHLGLEERAHDTYLDTLNRMSVLNWLCKLGHEECIKEALHRVRLWQNYEITISENVQTPFFCAAIAAGNQTDWDFLYSKYEEETDEDLRTRILNALGCSENKDILRRYLRKILDFTNGFEMNNRKTALAAIINGGSTGRSLLLSEFKKQYSLINKYFPDGSILRSLCNKLSTASHLLDILQILNKEQLNESLISGLKNNFAWREKHLTFVENWFSTSNGEE